MKKSTKTFAAILTGTAIVGSIAVATNSRKREKSGVVPAKPGESLGERMVAESERPVCGEDITVPADDRD